ncbi:MAG: hypothetical protein FWE46_06940 [Coriobacteriia bacterium]|nr:hypothetical protein [Coriobacteriia bacterium]
MSKDSSKSTRFATIGRIIKTHGKDGEVSVRLAFTLPDRDEEVALMRTSSAILEHCGAVWLVPPPLENRMLAVRSVREAHDRLLVKFVPHDSGFERLDKFELRELVGRDLLVERSEIPENLLLEFDGLQSEYADEESYGLGLEVRSDEYGNLGVVSEVIVTGANLVWIVTGSPYGEVLLPVNDDCILEIDEDAGIAQVQVMKGLIDVEPNPENPKNPEKPEKLDNTESEASSPCA